MAQRDIAKELDSLKNDMHDLREDLGDLLGSLREHAADSAESATGRMRDEAKRRVDQVREAVDMVRDRGGDAVEELRKKVRHRPVAGTLIAMGIGIVVGRILAAAR